MDLRSVQLKPQRPDIALPPFSPDLEWVGGEPPVTERITARGPLLVAFVELGELGSIRVLPLVERWASHYGAHGLTTLGVHSPRNDLARSTADLRAGLERLRVSFAVANDARYRTWHAYGCKGWPSLFLWGRGGTLRWFHLGVDRIDSCEVAIREALGAGDAAADRLPTPLRLQLQPPAEGLPAPSEEVFPSGTHERPWQGKPGEPLEVEYAGGSAWASIEGSGTVAVAVDGDPERARVIELSGPGVYELAAHDRHGVHEVSLTPSAGVRIWSVAFAPPPT